jgi:small nuclear ribonucleoprotein (snRNP)-like protein
MNREWVDKHVLVVTHDARVIQGMLVDLDSNWNLVLQNCIEQDMDMGTLLIRGDSICFVSEYLDKAFVKAVPFTQLVI